MINVNKICVIASLLLCTAVRAEISKEDCEMNADTLGYLLTISTTCGYETDQEQVNHLKAVNKACIAKYGQSFIYNASMSGMHSVKAEIADTSRSSACARAYSDYRTLFK